MLSLEREMCVTRFLFLCVFMLFALSYICVNYKKQIDMLKHFPLKPKQPHILLFLADDLGYYDIGYHGSKYKTPHLDKLASEGVKLDNYYVQPICTPSRSQLMTGRYQIHTGMQHEVIEPQQPWGLPLKYQTLPNKLKELGYSTHLVGKWHLGFYTKQHTPTYRGFDSFYGQYTSGKKYWTHLKREFLDLHEGLNVVKDKNGTYSASLFLQKALHIIKNHNHEQPLFLYYAFQLIHGPYEVPQQYIDLSSKEGLRGHERPYGGMISYMDDVVKNLTDAFKQHGLWDSTVMIFSSDNGAFSNTPLRGGKWTLFEGGLRVPAFVTSPMLQIKNYVNYKLFHISDWFPTLVHLAGGDTKGMNLDGYNQWDTISLDHSSKRKEILININPLHKPLGERKKGSTFDTRIRAGVRSGVWKLLTGDPGPLRGSRHKNSSHNTERKNIWLFNLRLDPTENNDLSHAHPHIVDNLLDRLSYYNSSAVPCVFARGDHEAKVQAMHHKAWVPWVETE